MHADVLGMFQGCLLWLVELTLCYLVCMQAIRRGTWLAVQLQLVFACMAVLLTFQALQYISQQPQSGWLHALETAAPYAAASAVAGALLCQPWTIPRQRQASDSSAKLGSSQREPEQAAASADRGEDKQEPNADLEREEHSSLHKPPEHVRFLIVQGFLHCQISVLICYQAAHRVVCAIGTETVNTSSVLPQLSMFLHLYIQAQLIPDHQMILQHQAVIEWHLVQAASVVPSAEDFDGWPDAPLLVRPAPLDYQRVNLDATGGAVCINDGG